MGRVRGTENLSLPMRATPHAHQHPAAASVVCLEPSRLAASSSGQAASHQAALTSSIAPSGMRGGSSRGAAGLVVAGTIQDDSEGMGSSPSPSFSGVCGSSNGAGSEKLSLRQIWGQALVESGLVGWGGGMVSVLAP